MVPVVVLWLRRIFRAVGAATCSLTHWSVQWTMYPPTRILAQRLGPYRPPFRDV